MIKLLIISNTPWDDANSFGSSFSNIFGGEKYEIANVYCQPGIPNTSVASKFFQITEKGILRSLRGKGCSGRVVTENHPTKKSSSAIRKKASIMRWQLMFWARDLVWATGAWKSKELDKFVLDFNPDMIVIPVYYSTYLNQIACYIQKLTNKPAIGYISDDNYSLKQVDFSPLYWIDRFIKRHYIRKAIGVTKLLYVITETQRKEYQQYFDVPCKVLFKGLEPKPFTPKPIGDKLRFVYTGNLGTGRWEVLGKLGKALDAKRCELLISSGSHLSDKQRKFMTSGEAVTFLGNIPLPEVAELQANADILVHVDTFNLSERYHYRLSFATKIVEYLSKSRCILAIGWEKSGSLQYLKENNAAIVVNNPDEIGSAVAKLIDSEEEINKYAERAWKCGVENHDINKIREMLYKDIKSVLTK